MNNDLLHLVKGWARTWGLRLIGVVLLVVLLVQVDLAHVSQVLRTADPLLVVLAVSMVIPLILFKTIRWQGILRSQSVEFALMPAFLSYFGSLFIGFLTPGRLGEFVKAVHVSQDCGISSGRAFSSVLADRLFDLGMLLVVGVAALLTLAPGEAELLALVASLLLIAVPFGLFLNDGTFSRIQQVGSNLGAPGKKLFAHDGWLADMRGGLCQLSWQRLLIASLLTVLAYGIFFLQCYLLALALHLPLNYIQVSYAIALGSLVTLLPISISGLGTREAAMIAFLSTIGIAAEPALGFSLLVFVTFYLAGGMIGAVAWWFKPVPLAALRTARAQR
jgi:hypothetical protein